MVAAFYFVKMAGYKYMQVNKKVQNIYFKLLAIKGWESVCMQVGQTHNKKTESILLGSL